jgi:hypothetical protein
MYRMLMKNKYKKLMEIYSELKREIQVKNQSLYEQWKAGGFLIDSDIVSMYPNLEEVIEKIES